jgi:hypothetical protein
VIWFDGPWVIGTEFAVDIDFRATHSLSLYLFNFKQAWRWMDGLENIGRVGADWTLFGT